MEPTWAPSARASRSALTRSKKLNLNSRSNLAPSNINPGSTDAFSRTACKCSISMHTLLWEYCCKENLDISTHHSGFTYSQTTQLRSILEKHLPTGIECSYAVCTRAVLAKYRKFYTYPNRVKRYQKIVIPPHSDELTMSIQFETAPWPWPRSQTLHTQIPWSLCSSGGVACALHSRFHSLQRTSAMHLQWCRTAQKQSSKTSKLTMVPAKCLIIYMYS